VHKSLRSTLTELAQCERAKDFFATHQDVFEVSGPATQVTISIVGFHCFLITLHDAIETSSIQ
jgi:hypothetical protein